MSPGIYGILSATVQDISFWMGFFTVGAFSLGRFSEKQSDLEEMDPPLSARYFTSRFRYYSSAFVFSGVYVLAYSVLIVLGSLPVFQPVLTTLFGSLDAGQAAGAAPPAPEASPAIGTPAWAAMVLMVLAPTVPWVQRSERKLRAWLQEFSDIPYKARELGSEIVDAIIIHFSRPASGGIAAARVRDVYQSLRELEEHLKSGGGTRLEQKYLAFFSQHAGVSEGIQQKFEQIEEDAPDALLADTRGKDDDALQSVSAVYKGHILALLRRYARFLACAMLYVETDEHRVRSRLRSNDGLARISQVPFRFTFSQAFLGLLGSVVLAMLTGVSISLMMDSSAGVAIQPSQVYDAFVHFSGFGLLTALAFIFPLCLAASVRLFMVDQLDRSAYGVEPLRMWTAVALTLFGCWTLSAFPIVFVQAARSWWFGDSLDLITAVTAALVPATANTLFVVWSGVRVSSATWLNAFADFLLFALVGGVTALFVAAFLSLRSGIGPQGQENWQLVYILARTMTGYIGAAIVVTGFFGALQCAVSRLSERHISSPAAKPVWDVKRPKRFEHETANVVALERG